MQLELNNLELELIGKALGEYAGIALQRAGRDDGEKLFQLEYIGRLLCSKFLINIDAQDTPQSIEAIFTDARDAYCGIADDATLGAACILGGLTDAGLATVTASIRDKKQRQDFKSNYKKVQSTLQKNMEHYK